MDKDQAEINAVRSTFPDAKHQTCWWHLKCSVKKTLKDSKSTDVLFHYTLGECAQYIPDFEPCWGSYAHRRFLYIDHDSSKCSCISRSRYLAGRAWLETNTTELRNDVLRLIDKHFNMNLFIPDSNESFCSSANSEKFRVSRKV